MAYFAVIRKIKIIYDRVILAISDNSADLLRHNRPARRAHTWHYYIGCGQQADPCHGGMLTELRKACVFTHQRQCRGDYNRSHVTGSDVLGYKIRLYAQHDQELTQHL